MKRTRKYRTKNSVLKFICKNGDWQKKSENPETVDSGIQKQCSIHSVLLSIYFVLTNIRFIDTKRCVNPIIVLRYPLENNNNRQGLRTPITPRYAQQVGVSPNQFGRVNDIIFYSLIYLGTLDDV